MYERRARPARPIAAMVLGALLLAPPPAGAVALPDPTRPPLAHQSAVRRMTLDQPQQFNVTAIKIAGGLRKAIVNNRLVGAGDRVDDGVIVDIAPGVVTIDYLSQRLHVTLLRGSVRRQPPSTGARMQ